jgi:N-methylhydantoinase B
MTDESRVSYRAEPGALSGADMALADPVTTAVIGNNLRSTCDQMKAALIRTSFHPIVYEMRDFAIGIYDRFGRLIADSPTLPLFGTLHFTIKAAVDAVGGEEALEPGDIILYNYPYGTGAPQTQPALVKPLFFEGELVAYAGCRAYWLDVGGLPEGVAERIDVFERGTIYPGVKLYSRGTRVDDIWRTCIANSRFPEETAGDITAQIVALNTGADGVDRILKRYGLSTFWVSIERILEHGETVVRSFIESIPDGHYTAQGFVDHNGVDSDPVTYDVSVVVNGSDVTIDYSAAGAANPGRMNTLFPTTVTVARVALGMLAGGGLPPNDGAFRPLEVVARRGSMFHAEFPAKHSLWWPLAVGALDAILDAFGQAIPDAVPATSGKDPMPIRTTGFREKTGRRWVDAQAHAVGQGGNAQADGGTYWVHAGSGGQTGSAEHREATAPQMIEQQELWVDSCGPGRHRGGLGIVYRIRMLEDQKAYAVVVMSAEDPAGMLGGGDGLRSVAQVEYPDGRVERLYGPSAAEFRDLPTGSLLELRLGGGAGYGPPEERATDAVLQDVEDGYTSIEHAKKSYPHAF